MELEADASIATETETEQSDAAAAAAAAPWPPALPASCVSCWPPRPGAGNLQGSAVQPDDWSTGPHSPTPSPSTAGGSSWSHPASPHPWGGPLWRRAPPPGSRTPPPCRTCACIARGVASACTPRQSKCMCALCCTARRCSGPPWPPCVPRGCQSEQRTAHMHLLCHGVRIQVEATPRGHNASTSAAGGPTAWGGALRHRGGLLAGRPPHHTQHRPTS